MDTAELAIVELLAKEHLVHTKKVCAALAERHFLEKDIQEAIVALERTGRISRIRPFAEENLALTKLGLREAAGKRFI